jgi:uncharacterized protein HemY
MLHRLGTAAMMMVAVMIMMMVVVVVVVPVPIVMMRGLFRNGFGVPHRSHRDFRRARLAGRRIASGLGQHRRHRFERVERRRV